jgi:phosphoribosylanthranilate isomerase
MRVKICGITNLADAQQAIEAGADALGFVFYPESPRYIDPDAARALVDALPPFVEKVGLFVNVTPEDVNRICQHAGMSLAQIHFEVDEPFLAALSVPALPVVRARTPDDLDRFADRYRLVDAYVETYGGAGKRLALEWFANRDNRRIILAGGLTPDNVAETLPYGFYGVDVSSGVEAQAGKKDPQKVERFIAHAKGL